MTGIIVLLYAAIGIGCGLIRLSAVAVGVIAMIPAALGAIVACSGGALSMLIAALIPLLVIECAYFITMLVVGRLSDAKPAAETAASRERVSGDLRLHRKPQIREEP